MARTIAPALERRLGRPVVVENRPGNTGQAAGEALKPSAASDGSTIAFMPSTTVALRAAVLAISPANRRDHAQAGYRGALPSRELAHAHGGVQTRTVQLERGDPMFSHVTVGSNDIARAKAFYDRVGEPLGLALHKASSESGLGYSRHDGRPQLWIVRPLDKQAATVGNGITIGLEAETRSAVDRAYEAALANGGTDEGKPGIRVHYHPNYYGAYVRDPDGNKVCIVCHKPA